MSVQDTVFKSNSKIVVLYVNKNLKSYVTKSCVSVSACLQSCGPSHSACCRVKASDLFVVTANKLLGERCAEPLMLLYFLLNCPSIRKHSPPAQKEHYGPLHPIVGGDERARVPIIFTAHSLCYKMNDPGVKHPLSISAHLSDSNSVFPRPKIGCSWGMYYGTLSSLLFPESCNLI